ncbi:MAG: HAMP domain-containing sensor histidine kinase [Bacteroidetes bacterium]|nr:HAMP domain-containing sensor histidine kinase [Bacteroidota bacterium]MDA0888747.1 HAMP domain-containing sensor histidine kinase [Bacteroidota bacterium]MDA1084254.1 HAMP domain-containing sensor histidine kinase [Bacteroidota bacterium]
MSFDLSYVNQRNSRTVGFVLALCFVGFTLWNTNKLIQRIQNDERQKMELWGLAQQELASSTNLNQPINPLTFQVLTAENAIPMIVVDDTKKLMFSNNINKRKLAQDSMGYVEELIREFSATHPPIEILHGDKLNQKMYYGNSALIQQLRYYPIAFFLIVAFLGGLLVAYYKSTQQVVANKLWTGMAKETAHQLGTPISSLLGWLTILEQHEVDEQLLSQIKSDIKRLETISARFSKIGSLPNKKPEKLSIVVKELVSYMQIRMPKAIALQVNENGHEDLVEINAELVVWVLENLIKNSIDAIRGEGAITIDLNWEKVATIIIRDTGNGIPKKLQKIIFNPGVTTKKRGWGLGLSLAKRIVEEYHGGKLSLIESSEKGTAFEIQLPLTQKLR